MGEYAPLFVCMSHRFCDVFLFISGLIVAVILTQAIRPPNADQTTSYSMYNGYAHVSEFNCYDNYIILQAHLTNDCNIFFSP